MPDTTIIDAFLATRSLTEQLAAPLSAEDQTVQSMPDVSPTKWHRAHVTWFFETFLLERFAADHEPFVAAYRELFNSYYEGVGPQYPRAARGSITRPGAAEVGAYRASVDARMHALLAAHPEHTEIARLTELGIHHEQQHQELLLMDIKHVLSLNPLQPAYRAAPAAMPMPQAPLQWLSFDGGLVETGHDGREFGFDNETPRHAVYVHPFQIADRLVTCGEWQAFIDDGGYRRSELWLSDGWHRVNDEGWRAPLYWLADDEHGWRIHTLAGTRAIDSDEPVCHVSFYEADAFAHWAGKRLPTEFEWEVASGRAGSPRSFDLDVLQPQTGRQRRRLPAPGVR